MKKLLILLLALMLCACAAAETLDPAEIYPEYTGAPLENSAEIIEDIMAANVVREIIAEYGALRQDIYIPDGETMTFYRADVACVTDGVEIIQIIEDPSIQIYTAAGTAYMIENGAIFTMPVANLPVNIPALEDFIFVYDENEHILAAREWENGTVYLSRAEETWIEYFLDEKMFICAIKMYSGAEKPECTGYITVSAAEVPEIPSFIIREAQK